MQQIPISPFSKQQKVNLLWVAVICLLRRGYYRQQKRLLLTSFFCRKTNKQTTKTSKTNIKWKGGASLNLILNFPLTIMGCYHKHLWEENNVLNPSIQKSVVCINNHQWLYISAIITGTLVNLKDSYLFGMGLKQIW